MCSSKVPLLYGYPLLFPAAQCLNVNEAQPLSKQERRSRSCGLRTLPFLPKQLSALFLTRVLAHELCVVQLPCGALDETHNDGRAWRPLRTRSEITIDSHPRCHQRDKRARRTSVSISQLWQSVSLNSQIKPVSAGLQFTCILCCALLFVSVL